MTPKNEKSAQQRPNYRKAYDILMDYFDWIPDEDKGEVSAQLEAVGC